MSLTFVVTGASRGLGLEFVKQLSAKGHTVFACARSPEKSEKLQELVKSNNCIHAVPLDTIDANSIKAASGKIAELAPEGVDVLINNSGIASKREHTALNTPGSEYIQVFETNVVGTSNVTQALLPLLRKKQTRRIINISSILGSCANTTASSVAAYRVSKAAENMLTRCFAGTLAEENFIVIAMHPGWVQTDMGGEKAPVTPEQSISGMIQVIDSATTKKNGAYLDYQGQKLEW